MKLASAVLTILVLAIATIGLSVPSVAQGKQADITVIEQWLDQKAVPFWHSRVLTRSLVAKTTAGDLLVDTHTSAGVPCESCHIAMDTEPNGRPPPLSSFNGTCVTCHGSMLEPAEGEEMSFPNPHVSPHLAPGEAPQCTECHRVHEPGEVTCNFCHRGFNFVID